MKVLEMASHVIQSQSAKEAAAEMQAAKKAAEKRRQIQVGTIPHTHTHARAKSHRQTAKRQASHVLNVQRRLDGVCLLSSQAAYRAASTPQETSSFRSATRDQRSRTGSRFVDPGDDSPGPCKYDVSV